MIRSFAPDTVALMGRICDEAYTELERTPPGATRAIRGVIAARVLAAICQGERDPERLKAIAFRKRSIFS
jgi:hypothetical protein